MIFMDALQEHPAGSGMLIRNSEQGIRISSKSIAQRDSPALLTLDLKLYAYAEYVDDGAMLKMHHPLVPAWAYLPTCAREVVVMTSRHD
jgi:hypothetical protein